MQTIEMNEDITTGLQQIRDANGPITVNFHGGFEEESVFTLILIANTVKKYPHETIASIDGCIPLFPAITANKIKMAPLAMVFIVPIRTFVNESESDAENRKQLIINSMKIKSLNITIRKLYKKYPKLQALFDDGEDHFLTREDLIANGVDVINNG